MCSRLVWFYLSSSFGSLHFCCFLVLYYISHFFLYLIYVSCKCRYFKLNLVWFQLPVSQQFIWVCECVLSKNKQKKYIYIYILYMRAERNRSRGYYLSANCSNPGGNIRHPSPLLSLPPCGPCGGSSVGASRTGDCRRF